MGKDERIGVVVLVVAVLAVMVFGLSMRNCRGNTSLNVQNIEIQTINPSNDDSAELLSQDSVDNIAKSDSISAKKGKKKGHDRSKKKVSKKSVKGKEEENNKEYRDLLKDKIEIASSPE